MDYEVSMTDVGPVFHEPTSNNFHQPDNVLVLELRLQTGRTTELS